MNQETARSFDVVLWGATGFTGRLVAEYLVDRYADSGLRWALAGRNRGKLEALRDDLAARSATASALAILTGDSLDRASLEAIAAETRVVCTTVGPYAVYGSDLVAACAARGTHYCDLTGEVQWVRRMIDQHHESAREAGARIVHCCGFDSIPSDLGTLFLQHLAEERGGEPYQRVAFYLERATGGFSGGTVASMINAIDEIKRNPSVRRMLGNPYSLVPDHEGRGPDGPDQRGVRYDKAVESWTGPFLMAMVNTRVVRRSHALLGYPWGREFRYSECMRMRRGPRGLFQALSLTGGLGAFATALSLRPLRALLSKTTLPSPGEGPSREKIESGFFKATLVGFDAGDAPARKAVVRGRRDPGYGATAVMLAESALCLALDGDALKSPGGLLTPASAMGMTLVDRLNANGVVTFEEG